MWYSYRNFSSLRSELFCLRNSGVAFQVGSTNVKDVILHDLTSQKAFIDAKCLGGVTQLLEFRGVFITSKFGSSSGFDSFLFDD